MAVVISMAMAITNATTIVTKTATTIAITIAITIAMALTKPNASENHLAQSVFAACSRFICTNIACNISVFRPCRTRRAPACNVVNGTIG